jgi:hypothetical protein
MKLILAIVLTFLVLDINAQNNIGFTLGSSYSLIHQHTQGLQAGGFSHHLGLECEKMLTPVQWHILTGLSYQYTYLPNYNNSPFVFDVQERITVNTAMHMHTLQVPLVVNYRFEKNKTSLGLGVLTYYVLSQHITQTINQSLQYDSLSNLRIHHNYNLNSTNEVHLMPRFYVAPTFSVGLQIHPNIALNARISYAMPTPNQSYLPYNKFNLVNNTLSLTYTINK